MGFLDNLRDRLRPQDDFAEDAYYDEYDNLPEESDPQHDTTGVLGNTRRPEAESVSVYTRSGRPVGAPGAGAGASVGAAAGRVQGYQAGAGYQPTSAPRPEYAPRTTEYTPRTSMGTGAMDGYAASETTVMPSVRSSRETGYASSTSATGVAGDMGLRAVPRVSSGALPPYVLKPVSYDDVQMVVRRVRTNQPVVLVFKSTNIEVAKRILDFSFGLSCGIMGSVEELGDRVFVVLPQGMQLSRADLDKLAADGYIERS